MAKWSRIGVFHVFIYLFIYSFYSNFFPSLCIKRASSVLKLRWANARLCWKESMTGSYDVLGQGWKSALDTTTISNELNDSAVQCSKGGGYSLLPNCPFFGHCLSLPSYYLHTVRDLGEGRAGSLWQGMCSSLGKLPWAFSIILLHIRLDPERKPVLPGGSG